MSFRRCGQTLGLCPSLCGVGAGSLTTLRFSHCSLDGVHPRRSAVAALDVHPSSYGGPYGDYGRLAGLSGYCYRLPSISIPRLLTTPRTQCQPTHPMPPRPPVPPASGRRLIYVRTTVNGDRYGSWPIPEACWCGDPLATTPTGPNLLPPALSAGLPPRVAIPTITVATVPVEPLLLEALPCDKYELEPSLLTQFILSSGSASHLEKKNKFYPCT